MLNKKEKATIVEATKDLYKLQIELSKEGVDVLVAEAITEKLEALLSND